MRRGIRLRSDVEEADKRGQRQRPLTKAAAYLKGKIAGSEEAAGDTTGTAAARGSRQRRRRAIELEEITNEDQIKIMIMNEDASQVEESGADSRETNEDSGSGDTFLRETNEDVDEGSGGTNPRETNEDRDTGESDEKAMGDVSGEMGQAIVVEAPPMVAMERDGAGNPTLYSCSAAADPLELATLTVEFDYEVETDGDVPRRESGGWIAELEGQLLSGLAEENGIPMSEGDDCSDFVAGDDTDSDGNGGARRMQRRSLGTRRWLSAETRILGVSIGKPDEAYDDGSESSGRPKRRGGNH